MRGWCIRIFWIRIEKDTYVWVQHLQVLGLRWPRMRALVDFVGGVIQRGLLLAGCVASGTICNQSENQSEVARDRFHFKNSEKYNLPFRFWDP